MKGDDHRNGDNSRPMRNTRHDVLELWITLARRPWGSLVIIPADRDGSAAEIANALADIGQRLSYGPVTAITVSTLEFGSALALADLQQHLDRERRHQGSTFIVGSAETAPAHGSDVSVTVTAPADQGGAGADAPSSPDATAAGEPGAAGEAPASDRPRVEALAVVPPARLIIAIPPVVREPLGLTAAQEADAIVLAVRLNRSRMGEVKRTIELVGRDRMIGCFIVR